MKIQKVLHRKLNMVLGLIFALLVTYISQNIPSFKDVISVPPESRITPTLTASQSATPVPGHGGVFKTVVSVVDGDTIKVEGGEIVRYIGMNTPETVAPGRGIECMGKEASTKNKELVQGKTVELEKDVSERDRYGRLLRYIWIGDVLINEVLVRDGFASVATYPPNVKYLDRFIEAERLAVSEGKGLWGGICPSPEPTIASPSAIIIGI